MSVGYGRRIDGLRCVATLAAGLVVGAGAIACGGADRGSAPRDAELRPVEVATPTPRDPEPQTTSTELAHGRYLVDSVLLCANCHSRRDWTYYSGPVEPGTEWSGGSVDIFRDGARAPALRNAFARWSAEELARALTEGRTPSGETLHDRWLLPNLASLRPEDALAVAHYLESGPDPDIEPESRDSGSGPVRGAYLVTIGRCALCHDETLAGGRIVEVPGGESSPSANITIHATAGVGRMNRTEFIDYFKSLASPDLARIPVKQGTPNTAMPWPQLSQMTREDLGAIYDYIGTLPAVDRPVVSH